MAQPYEGKDGRKPNQRLNTKVKAWTHDSNSDDNNLNLNRVVAIEISRMFRNLGSPFRRYRDRLVLPISSFHTITRPQSGVRNLADFYPGLPWTWGASSHDFEKYPVHLLNNEQFRERTLNLVFDLHQTSVQIANLIQLRLEDGLDAVIRGKMVEENICRVSEELNEIRAERARRRASNTEYRDLLDLPFLDVHEYQGATKKMETTGVTPDHEE